MVYLLQVLCWILPLWNSPGPDAAKQLGEAIDHVWIWTRPDWARMAIAILEGEAMRPDRAWWPSQQSSRGWDWLRSNFDKDGDGSVSASELPLGDREYARLDRDFDGRITQADFSSSRSDSSSPYRVWFRALDVDTNGRITKRELEEFFDEADQDKLGFLTVEDVRAALLARADPPPPVSGEAKDDMPPPVALLSMLFTGQLGSLTQGPMAGEAAPDFRLPSFDGKSEISLRDSLGKKPLVLIFGSFT